MKVSEIKYTNATESNRPRWIILSGFPSLCLSLHLSQSLGTAGTCAEGQMGTDRAHCIRMPQFGQRRQILLAPAQRRETWCFRCVFNSQEGQCEGVLDTVKYTGTETPKQKREIVSSRCATVTVQSFFGVVQSKKIKTEPSLLPVCSTAHRARLLLAHKVRYEVKFILSQE